MNIYLLKRTDKWSYDDYDAAVVIADNEDAARNFDVGGYPGACDWTTPDKIKVTLIGVAIPFSKPGIVLGSYNAG